MVLLPGGYQLRTSEPSNIVLIKVFKGTDKDGNPKDSEGDPRYFSSLPAAMERWYRLMTWELLSAKEVMDLKEITASLKALTDEAKRIIGTMTFAGRR